ncbi:MAG: tRNA (guanosine(46)-N7)-methyltransferase TrmB [Paenibacillaceae bacterium]|nr:tRNA (guanosine(46)-N7)-methyltransferase TrmB [Paenibacillaceae bacterium]
MIIVRLRGKKRAKTDEWAREVVVDPSAHKGSWKRVFGNDKPIFVELGSGKGAFVTQMRVRHPEVNWIGVEKYDALIGRISEMAMRTRHEQGSDRADNLRLICGDIGQLDQWFADGELDRLYLHFSDPWPKMRHARRRLTHPHFLAMYARVLRDGGDVLMRTDNAPLFWYSQHRFAECGFVCVEAWQDDTGVAGIAAIPHVITEYERKFRMLGKPIYGMHVRHDRDGTATNGDIGAEASCAAEVR